MIKVGFPGASIGIFDVIFVYFMNLFLAATLGNLGLTTYMLCMDALVLGSIVDIGISETLTSIVPIYYAKHDYANINHLIRLSLIITVICAVVLTVITWVWPQGFLALYNFNHFFWGNMIMNAITTQKEFISGFDLAVLRVCSDFIKYSYTHCKNILLFEVLTVMAQA